jgi:hypothetical protein
VIQAQTSSGRISGSVTDNTGAAVVNAKVVVTSTDTQEARAVTSDERGFYVITNQPIGRYQVEVNQTGFKRAIRTGIEIVADAHVTVDFRLDLGEMTQSVEVSAGVTEQLNTVSGELSRVIDTKDVENLALNGRNYTELLTLVPGAVVTNPDSFSVSTSLASNNQTVNGNRADANNLTVDGAYNQVAGSNTSLMNNVGADFIQEVKIQTSNMSAEYGRKSGPAFNIVTKNGTNAYHGAAFEFLRNDAVDARNTFSPTKTPLRFNDFGGDVGGPIKKDKLFFFAGIEFKRLRQLQQPTKQSVPSMAELNGDFSAVKATLNYPGTKTPIPGQIIPPSMLTTDGKAIANVYREQIATAAAYTNSASANNIILEPNNPLNFRENLLRMDYKINENNTVYGRWIEDSNQVIDPFGTFSSSNLPVIPSNRQRPGQSFLVAETWVISAGLVNEARANASWASQNIPPYGDSWERSQYGFQYPSLYNGGLYHDGIPSVSITGFANFKGPSFSLHSPSTDIQFSDTLSWVKGDHTIKAGALLIRDRVDQNGRSNYTGNITFNTSGNPNTSGNALADALLGNFRTYQEASADPLGFFRFTTPEAFIQDSWRVNRKLSLEIGLRYQWMQPMYTQQNNMVNFVPALYNPATAVSITTTGTVVPGSGNPYDGLIRAGNGIPSDQIGRVPGATSALVQSVPAGAPRGLYNAANLWAPRFGFAYSVDSKTVVRGGFGIFYDRPEGNLTFSQVNLPPFLQNSEFDNGNLATPSGGVPANTLPIATISAINPNLKFSYVEQYSLNVQRDLWKGLFLETSYVGALGRHLLREPNINQPSFAALSANAALPTAQQVSTIYLNPYKGYTTIQQYLSDSTSNYHALQAYLAKRKGAVFFTSGYTFSKSLGDSSSQTDNPENPANRHFNYGPTSFDRRHAFVGTFVWSLPKLANLNMYVKTIAGSWQLSGIIRLQSGQYFTPTASTAIGTRRAEYLGGPVLATSNRGPNNWINTAAFGPAPAGAYGNAGVGIIEGPGLQTYNLSLGKHFAIKERYDLRFQADFFNAFNVSNFNTLGVVQTTAGFGTLTAAYPARNIQFGFRLSF